MDKETRDKLMRKFGKANLGKPEFQKRGTKVVKHDVKIESVSAFNMARRV